MSDKCFCHLNGYEVKDAKAREDIKKLDFIAQDFEEYREQGVGTPNINYILPLTTQAISVDEYGIQINQETEIEFESPSNTWDKYTVLNSRLPIVAGDNVNFTVDEENKLVKVNSNTIPCLANGISINDLYFNWNISIENMFLYFDSELDYTSPLWGVEEARFNVIAFGDLSLSVINLYNFEGCEGYALALINESDETLRQVFFISEYNENVWNLFDNKKANYGFSINNTFPGWRSGNYYNLGESKKIISCDVNAIKYVNFNNMLWHTITLMSKNLMSYNYHVEEITDSTVISHLYRIINGAKGRIIVKDSADNLYNITRCEYSKSSVTTKYTITFTNELLDDTAYIRTEYTANVTNGTINTTKRTMVVSGTPSITSESTWSPLTITYYNDTEIE